MQVRPHFSEWGLLHPGGSSTGSSTEPSGTTRRSAARDGTGAGFHSLVADPTTPGRLYVGGHQTVSVSPDGGTTWTRVSALDDADAMGWGFRAGAIFVSGHPGLNRSDDGAATFTRINDGLPGTDVHAFGAGRDVLYGSAADGGLFASTDDGATWEVRASDGTRAFFGRIVVDPDNDDHLFAPDAQRGVAGSTESTDGGRIWAVLDTGLQAATWLSRSGDSLDLLIASGPAGAARSDDGGQTWTTLGLPAGASLDEIAPDSPACSTPASTKASPSTSRSAATTDVPGRRRDPQQPRHARRRRRATQELPPPLAADRSHHGGRCCRLRRCPTGPGRTAAHRVGAHQW